MKNLIRGCILLGLCTLVHSAMAGEACVDNSQCSIAGQVCINGNCQWPNLNMTNESNVPMDDAAGLGDCYAFAGCQGPIVASNVMQAYCDSAGQSWYSYIMNWCY